MTKKFIFLILVIALLFSGCVERERYFYKGNNANTQFCYDIANKNFENQDQSSYVEDIRECANIESLESIKFDLKEMKQKDLISGSVSGSFLLISGSIYGKIEEKMYLVVTYYDPRINTYKITKFNLEQIEINTIDAKEKAYFKYRVVPENQWGNYWTFDNTIGVLYLPDGWGII